MYFPFEGTDGDTESIKILAKQLELERERLNIIINHYGISSKEAYTQSEVVDKLVVRYTKSMRNGER